MLATFDRPARHRGAQSLMRALSLVGLGAVLYATLYPGSDWRLRQPGAFAFLQAGLPRYWTWFDFTSNLVAYLLLALVMTLGWFGSVRMRWAIPLVVVCLSTLSLGLETLQGWLPGRVPSLLDIIANGAGALIGALLGAMLNHGLQVRDRFAVPVRERWYEQGAPIGWVLLLLWLSAQLVPQRLLFATGRVQSLLEDLARTLLLDPEFARLSLRLTPSTADGVLIEAASVISAVTVVGILILDLVRNSAHRLLLLAATAVTALVLRSIATQMVYGTGSPFAWLTPGAQGGLLVGVILLYAFATLGARARSATAVMLLLAGLVLVNAAPPDRYFETTASGLREGQLVSLHALLRFVSMLWPFAAIAYFWHAARHPR